MNYQTNKTRSNDLGGRARRKIAQATYERQSGNKAVTLNPPPWATKPAPTALERPE